MLVWHEGGICLASKRPSAVVLKGFSNLELTPGQKPEVAVNCQLCYILLTDHTAAVLQCNEIIL